MEHEQLLYLLFESSAELLTFIREKADDIEKVVIPNTGSSILTFHGMSVNFINDLGMIIHTLQQRILVGESNAEVILNDGILGRMRVKIEGPSRN